MFGAWWALDDLIKKAPRRFIMRSLSSSWSKSFSSDECEAYIILFMGLWYLFYPPWIHFQSDARSCIFQSWCVWILPICGYIYGPRYMGLSFSFPIFYLCLALRRNRCPHKQPGAGWGSAQGRAPSLRAEVGSARERARFLVGY